VVTDYEQVYNISGKISGIFLERRKRRLNLEIMPGNSMTEIYE